MNLQTVLSQLEQGLSGIVLPSSWCQGRTAFGGVSGALLFQAVKQVVKPTRRVLSISTNFIGPLIAEQPFDIKVEVLREGKSASQVLARIEQDGNTCVLAQFCFGESRKSELLVSNDETHQLIAPEPEQRIPYIPNMTPEFFQHVEICLQQGGMPFTGAMTSHLGGWMRFAEHEGFQNELQLLALSDAWPPTMLQMYPRPAPASTKRRYNEFLKPVQLEQSQWFGFEAVTHNSAGGYAIEEAKIWHPDGELLALSRQTVAVFA
jgi:acyl-CoA thioesterase